MGHTLTVPTGAELHDLHAVYTQHILPAVERCAGRLTRHWRDRDRAEEIAQHAAALAWRSLLREHARGRDMVSWPNLVAQRAFRDALRGRRLQGPESRKAVGHDIFDMLYEGRPASLPTCDSDELCAADLCACTDRRGADPAELGALRVDYHAWLATLSRRERLFVAILADGHGPSHAAECVGLGATWATVTRRRLRVSWHYYVGDWE